MEKDKFLSAEMVSAEIDKLNTRKNTIASEIEEKRGVFDSADVEQRDAILDEVSALEKEADEITADVAELEELRQKFEEQEQRMSLFHNVETVKVEERKKMETKDRFDTPEYRAAWQRYVLSEGKEIPAELRDGNATVTTDLTNVPIPTLMQSYVETAWEKFGKFSQIVSQMSVKGYFKVPIETAADGANWHEENGAAVSAETITLGSVLLAPKMIKKYLPYTDELAAMAPEEFMRYLADELVYRIVKALDDAIINRTDTNGEGVIGIVGNTLTETVAKALDFNAVNEAMPSLITWDNLTIAMNPETFFKNIMSLTDTVQRPIYTVQTSNTGKPQYYFNGQRIEFTNALPAYDDATAGQAWAIVGDFRAYRLNFPEGRTVRVLRDPYTLATEDIVRLIGRLYVAGNIVRPKHFVALTIPE